MDIFRFLAAGGIGEQTKKAADNAGTGSTASAAIGVILNSAYIIIGIVSVVYIIIGGINYSTSQGDPAKTKKAKDTILYSIIGLIVAILAFAITTFILNQFTK